MDVGQAIAALLASGAVSGGCVAAVIGYMVRRWMERVDAKIDALDARVILMMDQYRKQSTAERDWNSQHGINKDIFERINRVETVLEGVKSACYIRHGRD